MPRKKNTLLRTLVPLVLILGGAGVVAAVAVNTSNQTKPPTDPAAAPDEAAFTDVAPDDGTGAEEALAAEQPAGIDAPDERPAGNAPEDPVETVTDAAGDATETIQDAADHAADRAADAASDAVARPAAAGLGGLTPRVFGEAPPAEGLGSLDGEGGVSMRLEFSPFGAGIASLKLGEGFFETVERKEHVELQAQRTVPRPGRTDLTAVPFAALAVRVTDPASGESATVGLAGEGVWRPVASTPGLFEAFLDDGAGVPLLRLERRYGLLPDSFRVTIARRTENLTDRPLTVTWYEAGPIDLPEPVTRYGGDKRRVRFGYLQNPEAQAGSSFVTADRDLTGRHKVLGDRETDDAGYDRWSPEAPLWPTPKSAKGGRRLVWTAFTGRYFAVALHPLFDPQAAGAGGDGKLFEGVEQIDRLVLNPYLGKKEADSAVMVVRLNHTPEPVPAGGASEASMGVYAGPLLKPDLTADPLLTSLNLSGLIVYNFGGPCGEMCTFSWLTYVLMAVLRFAHSLTGDWALSIILLVLVVRTTLHPITKWSQVRLLRFSKQMQSIAPMQQKIREKYKDDSKRQQQEMAKLWQEEGINPAGALGCLPMLLQSPVWIALYASLYFAAELRHEAAFWGVFQSVTGGSWQFLADMSRPDQMLPLPKALHFTPPLIGGIYGEIQSINLLPVLMGVVFWAHQKYLSPPPSASMSAEMEQQQKIMKVMFPLMMPIFMYAAPSGLTIYFITNSTLGILENKHIRHNAEKKGLLDPEKIKAEKAAKRAARGDKPAKTGGFMAKLQALAEQQQELQQQKAGKAKKVQNTARKPEPKDRNYKKRK